MESLQIKTVKWAFPGCRSWAELVICFLGRAPGRALLSLSRLVVNGAGPANKSLQVATGAVCASSQRNSFLKLGGRKRHHRRKGFQCIQQKERNTIWGWLEFPEPYCNISKAWIQAGDVALLGRTRRIFCLCVWVRISLIALLSSILSYFLSRKGGCKSFLFRKGVLEQWRVSVSQAEMSCPSPVPPASPLEIFVEQINPAWYH